MNNNGIGILGVIGIVFVTLKLVGYIDWSWWYVTMPFWIGYLVLLVIFIMYALVVVASRAVKRK